MSTAVQQLKKTHDAHGWKPAPTDHIRNVDLLRTHTLLKCPCGWYGWVKNTALQANPN